MFYKDKKYYDTLRWDDIFKSEDEFYAKVVAINGVTTEIDMKELYTILSMKYVGANTRYTDEFSFIMALRRELYTAYPQYIEQKKLLNDMMNMDIAEIQKASNTLRNLVNNPTDPTPTANTVPISNLSTEQENVEMTSNKLNAVRSKYASISRNYLDQIYRSVDQLFRVILGEELFYIYKGENK